MIGSLFLIDLLQFLVERKTQLQGGILAFSFVNSTQCLAVIKNQSRTDRKSRPV